MWASLVPRSRLFPTSCILHSMIRRILLASLFASASLAFSQDPGFRAPEAPPRAPAAQSNAGAGTITGAAVLTSMDVLDDSRPIQPGYVISIRILEDRKDAVQQKVAVTGEVQVPYIGLVRAAGKSCRALAYSIKRDLEKSYFITATVVIAIDQIPVEENIRMVEQDTYVMFGFVMKQGKYDLPKYEDLTISQAILRAGGFAQFADVKHVKIVRTTPQGEKRIMVNVDDIMRKGLLQNDIFIRQNDVIIVPEKKINF
jgi:polysaccharide export outer membrane protein